VSEDEEFYVSKREEVANPLDTVARVAKAVSADFFRAFKRANSDNHLDQVRGIIEMMVLTIEAGEMPGRAFLPLPAHLPDSEKEMRSLVMSKVAADAPVKSDLLEWARVNRDAGDKSAKALENACDAIRRAQDILDDEDCTDEELNGWVEFIVDHLNKVWRIDTIEALRLMRVEWAPHTEAPEYQALIRAEIVSWSKKVVDHFDVTPQWLLTGEQSRNAFVPHAKPAVRGPRNPFKSRHDD
jgi:hypothetical protein